MSFSFLVTRSSQLLSQLAASLSPGGWLRLLEFLPDGRTVKVRTFSPLFAISPTTQSFVWRTEPYDEFSFQLEEGAF